MPRRLAILFTLIALLAACGGQPAAAPTAPAASSAPLTPTAIADAASAFPVTLEHKYGSTTLPAAPQRVLSLGYTDQDPILALGVQPIAVRYFFGDESQAVWPWAADRLNGVAPAVLNMPFGELNIEAIAALQPDLIVAVSAGITEDEYTTLSQIAPTLAQSDAYVDFGVPWQEQTRVIGEALGRGSEAEELVLLAEARFADLRAQYPAFEGATAAIAAPASDGQFFFSGPQHERQRVLSSLGFALPDALAEIAGEAFYGTISGERLDLLDTDVLLWTATPEQRPTIEANPLYQQLAAVQAGRVIWLDTSGAGDLAGPALVYSSVLSLPIVFEELVPQLAAALDGDPSTSTGATTSDAETGTTRSFTDDLGRVVELPANPQRVVILDPSRTMVHLVELGIVPVGATHNDATRGETGLFPDVIGDAAQQITSVGLIGSANLEAVQALQPDLILYNIPYQEIAVDLLAQIAPTVAYEFRSDYEEHFRRTAEIVGREQEAEAIIAAFQQQLDQRAASLQLNGRTFAMPLLVTEGDRLLLFGPGQLLGKTLEQLGGAIVPAAIDGTPLDFASEDISLELLPSLLDADTIILHRYVGRADDDPAVERLTASPIWQAVPAVQRGDVVVVDIQAAVGTFGYSGLNSLLDSIVAQLAP